MSNTNQILAQLTEAFAALGYQGKELTGKVLAAGYVYAVALDAPEAAAHFKRRLVELDAAE